MRKVLLVAAMLCSLLPSSAHAQAALSRERTLELVRACRYFVKDNVPDGAEFPNPLDELPTIKAKGKGYVWDDQVKIKTPLYVLTKKFGCVYDSGSDKISIRWKR
jgi:hypothetical protein